jgi:hypothetical protein
MSRKFVILIERIFFNSELGVFCYKQWVKSTSCIILWSSLLSTYFTPSGNRSAALHCCWNGMIAQAVWTMRPVFGLILSRLSRFDFSFILYFVGLARFTGNASRTVDSFINSFTGAYSPGWTFDLPFGVSWSHTIRHTVGLLWTSDQPFAETSTYTRQHNRQTSMPPAWFEPATQATKRPQIYALDRAATGIG